MHTRHRQHLGRRTMVCISHSWVSTMPDLIRHVGWCEMSMQALGHSVSRQHGIGQDRVHGRVTSSSLSSMAPTRYAVTPTLRTWSTQFITKSW